MRNETKSQYHQRRLTDLKGIRSQWEDHWSELAKFNAPGRLRLQPQTGVGQKNRSAILDSSSTFALRTLASGMHSGISSPARPWFQLMTLDPELREFGPVKTYLDDVQTRMREVFQSSNVYNSFHLGYGDLGLFGQSCGIHLADKERVVGLMQLLHGSFWLARDENGVANTLYRQFSWSVEKIVSKFGYDNCSTWVRNDYDNANYDRLYIVNHAIEPRHDRQFGKIDKKNKPFLSNYWEDANNGRMAAGLLKEDGFDSNPIIAPAWELTAEDDYAVSPGMDALPDVKQLQTLQRMSGEAIEKKIRPPMVGPPSMKNNPASLMPGSVTYVDDPTGHSYRPAIQVNMSITEVEEKINQTRQRIERAYYADLFLMLSQMEGIQPRNNMEIAERKEEKLLALGPVLENIYGGQLAPVIDRTYEAMEKAGMLPPPPPELQGQSLKIEYISMLAQAQKAVATGSIERLMSFAGNLSAVNPTVLDKIDMDEAIDKYAEALGAPPSVVVSDDKVQEVRKQRAAQQQQQQQAEQLATMAPAMQQGAQAAKVLSETDTGTTGSLLAKLGIA